MTTNLRQIKIKTNHWAEIIFSLVITLSFLTSCYFPGSNRQQSKNATKIISTFATDHIDIVFQLKVPESFNENETVVLEVIDEIEQYIIDLETQALVLQRGVSGVSQPGLDHWNIHPRLQSKSNYP